jgi:D-3-phosphoglycerate dehydrogenase
MSATLVPLTLDFLRWLDTEPRDYAEVMDAWRTACPRLTVWEVALDAGLITRTHTPDGPLRVSLTPEVRKRLADAVR